MIAGGHGRLHALQPLDEGSVFFGGGGFGNFFFEKKEEQTKTGENGEKDKEKVGGHGLPII